MKNSETDPGKILLVGIGNGGRGDDGLGWRFVEMIDGFGCDFFDYEFRYQLQVEDAALVKDYRIVIFVDASHDKFSRGFEIKSCVPAHHAFFSTHAQAPGAILHLAKALYDASPKAYVLAISGKDWELKTALSTEAEKNLEAALTYFMEQFLPVVYPKQVFHFG